MAISLQLTKAIIFAKNPKIQRPTSKLELTYDFLVCCIDADDFVWNETQGYSKSKKKTKNLSYATISFTYYRTSACHKLTHAHIIEMMS